MKICQICVLFLLQIEFHFHLNFKFNNALIEMSIRLSNTIFLAQCMDKSHAEDAVTIHRILKIRGIDDAFETHVPYHGKEYCLAAMSQSKSRDHAKIVSNLLKDSNIKFVKTLTKEETPF